MSWIATSKKIETVSPYSRKKVDQFSVVNFGTGMTSSEAKAFCQAQNMDYPSDQLEHYPSLFKQIENFLGTGTHGAIIGV